MLTTGEIVNAVKAILMVGGCLVCVFVVLFVCSPVHWHQEIIQLFSLKYGHTEETAPW